MITGKVVPALNKAPYFEHICGSRGIPPHILNLGARLRWLVNFLPRFLYQWRSSQYPWDRRPG